MRASAVAVVLVVLVVLATAAPALAQADEGSVVGRPRLTLSAPDNRVSAGERIALDVFVANAGDLDRGGPPALEERVKTARNVRLEIDEDRLADEVAAAVEVRTGSVVLGTVPEGLGGPASFSIDVNESLPAGEYEIPVEATYDYEGVIEYRGTTATNVVDFSQSVTETVTLVVESEPRFDVAPAGREIVTAGDARRYELTVTNEGNRTATDATVTLQAGNSSLFFGNRSAPRATETAFVPRLAPGESRTIAVRLGADAATEPGVSVLTSRVRFTDPNGISSTSRLQAVGVPVGAERTFALQNVTATLRVGETGTVRGAVVNTGQAPVSNGTVVVRSASPALAPRETSLPVGELRPGEAVPFSVRVDVSNRTDPGDRRLSVRVRYRDDEDDPHASDALQARVAVAPEQSFAVRGLADTLQVGERGVVRGRVVNTGQVTVTDVVVVLRGDPATLAPLETTVAVGTLAPNESAPFSFRVDAAPDAQATSRPVSFGVRYRDPSGDARTSDPIDAAVSVAPEQSFAIRNASDTLRVAATGAVRGRIVNTGPETVSNVVVALVPENGTLVPRETEVAVGTLAPGEGASFALRLDAGNRTDAGPRQLSFRVRYRGQGDEVRTSGPLDVRVTVAPEREFAVRDVSDSLRVGETGAVRGVVVNEGDEPVRNATVVVTSRTPALRPRATEYAIGTLAPGEAVPFSFDVDVSNRTGAGPRTLGFRVRYRDRSGTVRASDEVDARVTVGPEQSFALRNVSDTLRVGETGTVRGTVVNTGQAPVSGVVVVLRSTGPTLVPRETEFAVGDLGPGEAAPFAFRVAVSNRTDDGPRSLTVGVRYRDASGDAAVGDPLDALVRVAPATDAFRVEPLSASVEVDGRTVLELRVTNRRNETFADVRALLSVAGSLETDDPTTFVPRLGPGESTTIRFDLSATDDAIPKTDSVQVRFTYTDEAGDRTTSDPYFVAVTVERPETTFPVVPAVAVGLALAVAAVWWWRRRR